MFRPVFRPPCLKLYSHDRVSREAWSAGGSKLGRRANATDDRF